MKLSYKKILGSLVTLEIMWLVAHAITKSLVTEKNLIILISVMMIFVLICFFGLKMVGGLLIKYIEAKNTTITKKNYKSAKKE